MILNQAENIMLGSTEVQRVYLGSELIWERRKYGSTKIALVTLDANYQETSEVQYFDDLSYHNWSALVTVLRANTDVFYKMIVGDDSSGLSGRSFVNCTRLYSAELGKPVSALPANCFEGCQNLTEIQWSENLKSMGTATFYGCSSLTAVTLPDGMTGLAKSLFNNCSRLAQVILPESITSIGEYAFHRCYALKSITIPANVTTIYSNAFLYCSGITITIQKAENSISGSPWSASNATIIWTE